MQHKIYLPIAAKDERGLAELFASHGIYSCCVAAGSDIVTDAKLAAVVRREYNTVAPNAEFTMKFTQPERGAWNFDRTDTVMDFCSAHGMKMRGLHVFWFYRECLPEWLKARNWSRNDMRQIMVDHLTALTARYPSIDVWDVVNEAFMWDGKLTPSVYQHAGTDYVPWIFEEARRIAPGKKLFVNETYPDQYYSHSGCAVGWERAVLGLADANLIDGVGVQLHCVLPSFREFPFSRLKWLADALANRGKELHVTEMDVRVEVPATSRDYSEQAWLYQHVLMTLLPCKNFTWWGTWGINDARDWTRQFFPGYGDAMLLNRYNEDKPAMRAMRDTLRLVANSTRDERCSTCSCR